MGFHLAIFILFLFYLWFDSLFLHSFLSSSNLIST